MPPLFQNPIKFEVTEIPYARKYRYRNKKSKNSEIVKAERKNNKVHRLNCGGSLWYECNSKQSLHRMKNKTASAFSKLSITVKFIELEAINMPRYLCRFIYRATRLRLSRLINCTTLRDVEAVKIHDKKKKGRKRSP